VLSFRSVRWRVLVLIAVVMAAIAEACSLFIPFDEYPGDPLEAGTSTDGSVNGDGGGADVVDEDSTAVKCRGINKQTDPLNCGACDRACINGTCTGGKCEIEVVSAGTDSGTILGLGTDVLADGGVGFLYLTRSKGFIGRIPIPFPTDGTTVEEDRYMGPTVPPIGDITVNIAGSQVLYAADAGIIGVRTGPTFDSGQVDVVVRRQDVRVVSVRGATNILYFGDGTGLGWTQANNVFRADAGFDAAPYPNPVVALTTSGQQILWTTDRGEVHRMQTLTPENPATVMTPTDRGGTTSIAVWGKRLYLGQKSQGIVMFTYDTTADPNKPTTVASSDIEALATDGAHVYAIDFGISAKSARLLRMDLDTTDFAVLADGLTRSPALAIFGGYVYFADGERLLRTPK
jgi:hypothetical protein